MVKIIFTFILFSLSYICYADTLSINSNILTNDISAKTISIDTGLCNEIYFDTTGRYDDLPVNVGHLRHNSIEGTLEYGLNGGNVIGQFFLENLNRVENNSSQTIKNGHPVMFTGTHGNSGIVCVAEAVNGVLSPYIVGLATEDILPDSVGFLCWDGKLRGISTDGSEYNETWNDSDILFYNFTDSGLTNDTNKLINYPLLVLGSVINAHATNGAIQVKIMRLRPENRYLPNFITPDTIYADSVVIGKLEADSIIIKEISVDTFYQYYATHLFWYFPDTSYAFSFAIADSWYQVTTVQANLYTKAENDGFTNSGDTIIIPIAGDYDFSGKINFEGTNAQTYRVRFYNVTKDTAIPIGGSVTAQGPGNTNAIAVMGYGADLDVGDNIIVQMSNADNTGGATLRSGLIKIKLIHRNY